MHELRIARFYHGSTFRRLLICPSWNLLGKFPSSVQDGIPIKRVCSDGTFQIGNEYFKTFCFVCNQNKQILQYFDAIGFNIFLFTSVVKSSQTIIEYNILVSRILEIKV